MPPSGYSHIHTHAINAFLLSISQDLKNEGIEKHQTPIQSLNREIADITREISTGNRSDIVNTILKLTQDFYYRILSFAPNNYQDFDKIRQNIAKDITQEILDVHII